MKKAQAAMEYLVTYGWALLALFIVVAFLISSGAFSTSAFSVQECIFQPDLPCTSFILYKDGSGGASQTKLRFTLVNGLGFPMNISNVTYTTSDLGESGRKDWVGAIPSPQYVPSGMRSNFSIDFPGPKQPHARQFKTIFVNLSYYSCRNLPCSGPYTTSGRISAIVEEG
ncbi:MAG: hypothetical protein QW275_03615 [Candidatus Anstonellaceae archaeon]